MSKYTEEQIKYLREINEIRKIKDRPLSTTESMILNEKLKLIKSNQKPSSKKIAAKLGFGQSTVASTLCRPAVKAELQRELDNIGLTAKKLAIKLNEGLDAVKYETVYDNNKPKTIESPDHQARVKYISLAIDVRGDKAPLQFNMTEKIEVVRKQLKDIIDSDDEFIEGEIIQEEQLEDRKEEVKDVVGKDKDIQEPKSEG